MYTEEKLLILQIGFYISIAVMSAAFLAVVFLYFKFKIRFIYTFRLRAGRKKGPGTKRRGKEEKG